MTRNRRLLWVFFLGGLELGLASWEVLAQSLPNGPEFQVNQYTTSAQRAFGVASDSEGGFVVVWESYGSFGSDTADRSVQARHYTSAGRSSGNQVQVNTYTANHQLLPTIASDPQGGFVVAWASGVDYSIYDSIRARRLAPNGTPLGSELIVNSYSQVDHLAPSVGIDGQGTFVITWHSNGSPGNDSDGWSIQARRFSPNGMPLGPQFQVNQYTTGSQEYPSIAVTPQGSFVIVWQSYGSFESDSSGFSVQARRFTSDGSPAAGQFQVNLLTYAAQARASVDIDSEGGFVVAWESSDSNGSDNDNLSIQARRFDAGGFPFGPETQVNTYTTREQGSPWVRSLPGGGFVVAWTSYGSLGSDSSGRSVQARKFGAGGGALGGEFQLNTYTTENQYHPRIAIGPLNDMAAIWTSDGSSGNDDQGVSVQARRFDGLFRDGFEVGHSGRWSVVFP